MATSKDRLKLLVKELKKQGRCTSLTDFSVQVGYSEAWGKNLTEKSLDLKACRLINFIFADVNTEWLTTGEGEMFKPDAKPVDGGAEINLTKTIEKSNVNVGGTQQIGTELNTERIKELEAQCARLKDEVEFLRGMLRDAMLINKHEHT